MSDKPDRQEKVHDPSPTRLRKAREDGNVFKSKELVSVGVLAAGGATLVAGAPAAFATLQEVARGLFQNAASAPLNVDSLPSLMAGVALPVLGFLLPFFGVVMVAGAASNVAQTGWNVTAKPLAPKFNRISPLEGIKRLFSTKGLFEAGKAVAKVAVVGPIIYAVLRDRADEVLQLSALPIDAAVSNAGTWIVELAAPVLGALLVLAAADYAFERHKWFTDLKMTEKEVKDEAKDQDGDPHMKGKRRQKARELAMRPRLDHAVMRADVVVTNPTHYAVALRFDPDECPAPVVLCKGVRKRALAIKTLAAELGIPTVENVPLARGLFAAVEEGDPIDESLYAAVAAVLAEVYRVRAER